MPKKTTEAGEVKKKETQASSDLVKMTRELPEGASGPTEADVHPNEVDNYKAGGWRVAG